MGREFPHSNVVGFDLVLPQTKVYVFRRFASFICPHFLALLHIFLFPILHCRGP